MGRFGFKKIWQRGKWGVLGGLGILGVWGLVYLRSLPDGRLRVVFCDVGQGDGIYISAPDGSDILVDGGPNSKVLECLGENMPFWDRKIEMLVLTHPQADHLNGFVRVLKRYDIDYFVSSPIGNDTKGYRELVSLIQQNSVPVRNVYSGGVIKLPRDVTLRVLWPSRDFVTRELAETNFFSVPSSPASLQKPPRQRNFLRSSSICCSDLVKFKAPRIRSFISGLVNPRPSSDDAKNLLPSDVSVPGWLQTAVTSKKLSSPSSLELLSKRSDILGASTTHDDLNDFSIVMELKYGDFEVLLTGDADEEIQDEIMLESHVGPVEIFKIPHHGSKYGILDEYLDAAQPRFAVVSVGKNRWGHPDNSILGRLEVRGLRVWRTDKHGDIKITTDGSRYWVESDKDTTE